MARKAWTTSSSDSPPLPSISKAHSMGRRRSGDEAGCLLSAKSAMTVGWAIIRRRHALAAELPAQAAHSHGLQPLLVHDVEGGSQDPLPGQGLPAVRDGAERIALLKLRVHVLQMFNMFNFLGHISSLSGLTPYIVRIDYLTP